MVVMGFETLEPPNSGFRSCGATIGRLKLREPQVGAQEMHDNVTSHNGHLFQFFYGHTLTAVFNTYDIQPSGNMAHRKVYEELIMLMNYNPPSVHVAQDSQVTFCYPNMFYDRHLDSWLSLKDVKIASSLQSDIAKLVYDELKALKAKDQSLSPAESNNQDGCRFSTKEIRESEALQTTISDVRSIVGFYHQVSLLLLCLDCIHYGVVPSCRHMAFHLVVLRIWT